jgi:hypothetical protein
MIVGFIINFWIIASLSAARGGRIVWVLQRREGMAARGIGTGRMLINAALMAKDKHLFESATGFKDIFFFAIPPSGTCPWRHLFSPKPTLALWRCTLKPRGAPPALPAYRGEGMP